MSNCQGPLWEYEPPALALEFEFLPLLLSEPLDLPAYRAALAATGFTLPEVVPLSPAAP